MAGGGSSSSATSSTDTTTTYNTAASEQAVSVSGNSNNVVVERLDADLLEKSFGTYSENLESVALASIGGNSDLAATAINAANDAYETSFSEASELVGDQVEMLSQFGQEMKQGNETMGERVVMAVIIMAVIIAVALIIMAGKMKR